MTKPKLKFNPVAPEYFANPYDIYKRMRVETPLYYDEELDFYALTRHEDVAAAFKDHDAFSSAYGCDMGMIRSGKVPREVDHLPGSAGSSPDAQPAQQGVHPAGDPVAARDGRRADRALPGQGRSRQLRRRTRFLWSISGRGHHPHGRGARGIPPTGPALDRRRLAPRAGTDRHQREEHGRPTWTPACTTTAWSRNAAQTRRTT